MTRRAICTVLCFLLGILLTPWPKVCAAAQDDSRKPPKKSAPLPLDLELSRLEICLHGDPNLPILAAGLSSGYSGGGGGGYAGGGGRYGRRGASFAPVAPQPPPEYMESLDRDYAACSYAFHDKDSADRHEILDAVHKDIEIKSKDCAEFGMGRLVPVRISTIHAGTPTEGWSAFYKWSSVSGFPVSELRAPGLTSPATISLPPGVYAFRAELRAPDGSTKKTDVVTTPVAGQKLIDVQLPVP